MRFGSQEEWRFDNIVMVTMKMIMVDAGDDIDDKDDDDDSDVDNTADDDVE